MKELKKEPLVFIKHIRDSIDEIKSFTKGISKDKFMKEKIVQNATIRSIEVIGEAVKNLPIDFTVKYPFIEWNKIAGTRDKIIHHYFGIDLEKIWEVVVNDIPKLEKNIQEILNEESK